MIFHSLSLEHFTPAFRDPVVIPLANQGFVLIRGRNEVSRALDSNGVGKTTLLPHALSYVLYGMLLDGRRGDEVANRFTSDPCRVILQAEDAQGVWSIERGRRPKVLTLTGFAQTGNEDDEALQGLIESRLGFGALTFRNAIVFSQGQLDRFAQADQAEQLRMLDEIQGLDFRGGLDRAKTWRAEQGARIEALSAEQVQVQSQIVDAEATRIELSKARAAFEVTKAERVKQSQMRFAQATTTRKECERALSMVEDAASHRDEADRAVRHWEVAMQRWTEAQALVTQRRIEHEQAEQAVQEAGEMMTRLEGAQTCPTCRQPLLSSLNLWVKEAAARQDVAARRSEARQTARDLEQQAHKKVGSDPRPTLAALDATIRERPQRQQAALSSRQAETEAKAQVRTEQQARWESAQAYRAAEAIEAEGKVRLVALTKDLARAQTTGRVAEYWVTAFGDRGLRSLLIGSASGFLTERVTHHLAALAAGEVTWAISPLRQLKGGGTRERLTLTSEWAWGGTGLKGSYGQDRRVDLAVFAALQDFAEEQSTRPFPLKVWDEPGDALDGTGRELFLDWVSAEARRRGSGFLMTHNAEIAAMADPDAIWTVVLTEKGSHVEIER